MPNKLLTLDEVSEILQVTRQRAERLAREGILPRVYVGRQVRVDADKLQQWIDNGGQQFPGGWKKESLELQQA